MKVDFKFPRRSFSASVMISIVILGIFLWIVTSKLEVSVQQIISSGLSALILVSSVIITAAIVVVFFYLTRYMHQQILKKSIK